MAKRIERINKSVKEILEDLLSGHREAAFSGPASALKYLNRTLEGQQSLPNGVKAVAYDLMAEAKAKLEETLARRQLQAERKIANAEAQAQAEVKAAAAELAAQMAEHILVARLAGAKSDPLIDKAISQLATKLQ